MVYGMLKIKRVSDVMGKQVYTSEGDYFGQVEELNIVDNKVDGWKIKIGSGFVGLLGGARGVIIPHQFVKAVGDVILVNNASLPFKEQENIMASAESSSSGSGDVLELA